MLLIIRSVIHSRWHSPNILLSSSRVYKPYIGRFANRLFGWPLNLLASYCSCCLLFYQHIHDSENVVQAVASSTVGSMLTCKRAIQSLCCLVLFGAAAGCCCCSGIRSSLWVPASPWNPSSTSLLCCWSFCTSPLSFVPRSGQNFLLADVCHLARHTCNK